MIRQIARRSLNLSVKRAGPMRTFAGKHPGIQEPTGILFGEKELVGKASRKWESWEHGYWATCVIGVLFGVLILPNRPDTSVGTWSKREAEARKKQNVEDPILGQSYAVSSNSYVKGAIGENPTVGEE